MQRGPRSRPEIICHDCRRAEPQQAKTARRPAVCEQCGQEFQSYRGGNSPTGWTTYCSKSCARTAINLRRTAHLTPEQKRERRAQKSKTDCRKRRLRLSAAGWDGVTDADILDRDKWICKMPVCIFGSRRISKTRKYPDPRSPGVDHIVPISLGGDDTAFNKRAAHHGCNMARGAGRLGEQMPLNFGTVGEILPRKRQPRQRMCGVCSEPMYLSGKRWHCDLHSPVYILACKYCSAPVVCQVNNASRVIRCHACRVRLHNRTADLTCEVAGCPRPTFFKATPLCAPHYLRFKKHGDVLADVPIASSHYERWEVSITPRVSSPSTVG